MRAAVMVLVLLTVGFACSNARAQNSSPMIGTSFRDRPDLPEMVVLPAGTFTMGTSAVEAAEEGVAPDRADQEQPQHEVVLPSAFAMGRYPVTQAEFAAFIQATHYQPRNGCDRWSGTAWQTDPAISWHNPGFGQTSRDPVVCVSVIDVAQYLDWLNSLLPQGAAAYRLPTEAEWEYAARAGTTTSHPWGDDAGRPGEHANFAQIRNGTVPVGKYQPNAWGLSDMLGNAWQWTMDCWHPTYEGAPRDGSQPWVNGDCRRHVRRGGSWFDQAQQIRSGSRGWDGTSNRNIGNGFRLARPLAAGTIPKG
jgi:formylglycine-generating enzyme required for sulfatase activity